MVTSIFARTKKQDYGNGILNFAANYMLCSHHPTYRIRLACKGNSSRRAANTATTRLFSPWDGATTNRNHGIVPVWLSDQARRSSRQGSQFHIWNVCRHLSLEQRKNRSHVCESGFYRDTRHLAPSRPTPGAFSKEVSLTRKRRAQSRQATVYGTADQQLVDIVGGGSVFNGISGLGRIRR